VVSVVIYGWLGVISYLPTKNRSDSWSAVELLEHIAPTACMASCYTRDELHQPYSWSPPVVMGLSSPAWVSFNDGAPGDHFPAAKKART
jgi:hypothetical protein